MYSYAAAKSAGLEEPEAELIAWNTANPQDANVNFQLGSIAIANGKSEEADNPAISDTLGWLYVQRGDASRGLPLLEHAAARLPQNRDVRYHWAVALSETGDPRRALEVLQELLATGGDFGKRSEAEELVAELQNSRTP
jgi:thioredoxin-like negative regulator of GroEL